MSNWLPVFSLIRACCMASPDQRMSHVLDTPLHHEEHVPLILHSINLQTKDSSSDVRRWISSLDLFPKVDPKYLRKSTIGGISTLCLYFVLLMFLIFCIFQCIFPPTISTLAISSRNVSSDDFFLSLNLTVHSPCEELALLYLRPGSGSILVDPLLQLIPVLNNTHCGISGRLSITQSSRKLVIVPVSHVGINAKEHVATISIDRRVSFQHTIHQFEFGNSFPGRISPLNGIQSHSDENNENLSFFQYFVKIIPTNWHKWSLFTSGIVSSFQYAVQSYYRPGAQKTTGEMGIIFEFDFEPIIIELTQSSSFRKENGLFGEVSIFVIQLLGVMGGLGAISDLLYSFVHALIH